MLVMAQVSAVAEVLLTIGHRPADAYRRTQKGSRWTLTIGAIRPSQHVRHVAVMRSSMETILRSSPAVIALL